MKFEHFYNNLLVEVTDVSNISINWRDEDEAVFKAAGDTYFVSFERGYNPNGVYSVSFKNTKGYSKTGEAGPGGARSVLSGVMTTMREKIERFEEEYGAKPFQFNFDAAYELSPNSKFRNLIPNSQGVMRGNASHVEDLSEEELRKLILEVASRPMMYLAIGLEFGDKYGYKTTHHSNVLRELTSGANDLRSVRKTAVQTLSRMRHSDLVRILGMIMQETRVMFEVTNQNADEGDYRINRAEEIAEEIDWAEYGTIKAWIDQGYEHEILSSASPETLTEIAQWGLLLDDLIDYPDSAVVEQVLKHKPEWAVRVVDSEEEVRMVAITSILTNYGDNAEGYSMILKNSTFFAAQNIEYIIETRDPSEEAIQEMVDIAENYGHDVSAIRDKYL